MKKIIFACLAAAALVSLSACSTAKDNQSESTMNTTTNTTTMTPDASAPIIVPHTP